MRAYPRFRSKTRQKPRNTSKSSETENTKSYLYINDCIEAILVGLGKSTEQVEIYNVGSKDQINVKTITEIVAEEMGLQNVKFKFTGGVDGGRGWKGDIKNMLLGITKLKAKGWKPKHSSAQAIKIATQFILEEVLADAG